MQVSASAIEPAAFLHEANVHVRSGRSAPFATGASRI
jgi:hypothetical protein